VAVNNSVHVYQVKTAGVSYTVDFKKRVNFITFTKVNPSTLKILPNYRIQLDKSYDDES